jgi:catechol 2,3-dioxygenase-like lactoylglutathione lyase family enzyme
MSVRAATRAPGLHHIGVQTFDLANALSWYRDFFGCELTWSTDRFSALTRSRLPGVTRLTEVRVGDLRFHLFERAGVERAQVADQVQFQHLCVEVDTPEQLPTLRHRWIALHDSGRYRFLRADPPTEIVVDADGVRSFYCLDVNGLEFEFTHVPEATS